MAAIALMLGGCNLLSSSEQQSLGGGGTAAVADPPSGGRSSEGGGSSGSGGASSDGGGRGPDTVGEPVEEPVLRSEAPIRSQAPLMEVPQVLAASRCAALDQCLGDVALESLLGQEDCVERTTEELLATLFDGVESAIEAGRLLYDPAGLEPCLAAIEALACDVVAVGFPLECALVLRGNVLLGGECGGDLECQGPAFCQPDEQCVKRCVTLLPNGADCERDSQCQIGSICASGTCQQPVPEGGECSGEEGDAPCGLGLSCVGAEGGDPGRCEAGAGDGGIGDPCSDEGTGCAVDLVCLSGSGGERTCGEPVAEPGAACYLGLPGECAAGEYCDLSAGLLAGQCEPLPGDGEPCAGLGLCAAGRVCVPDGDLLVCQPIVGNDQPCLHDLMCRSQNCVDLVCRAPTTCE